MTMKETCPKPLPARLANIIERAGTCQGVLARERVMSLMAKIGLSMGASQELAAIHKSVLELPRSWVIAGLVFRP